jgi:GT2 family glycosyltransferase
MCKVLAIVLNYNKKDMVLSCLKSLNQQHYDSCRIVVVDNASTDGSQEAIRDIFPKTELLCSERNLGASQGRNFGVEYAKSQDDFGYILFLDDDAEVATESIARLVDALESEPQIGIVCGKTYIDLDSRVLMSTGIIERFHWARCYDRGAAELDLGQYDRDGLVDACGGFALMIRASLFDDLEGFDEVFSPYGWEDVDLCLRARQLGFHTKYIHDAVFAHKGTQVGRSPLPLYERSKVKNFLILLLRHASLSQKLCALVSVPLRGAWLILNFARKGRWNIIGAQIDGIKDTFSALTFRSKDP